MDSLEHYMSKLERNINVLDKAPDGVREQCTKNIIWARELIGRLEQLDYQEREHAIEKIHQILDSDYQAMGFEITQKNNTGKIF